jgi:hypothetical protein
MFALFCFPSYNPGSVETVSTHNLVVNTWIVEVISSLIMFVPFLFYVASA